MALVRSTATAALLVLAPVAASAQAKILVVGDSLSAEYGLARGQGWVALLDQRLATAPSTSPAAGAAWQVVNASISGDTTAGGRARLAALLLQHKPQWVLLELGGNDALRGLPLAQTEDNLNTMAAQAKAAGARVVVLGMAVPPNYGRKYGEDFQAVFVKVAKAQNAALVPFMLAGVADVAESQQWFQADRIHPNAAAHPRILANVWAVLEPLLVAAPGKKKP